MTRRTVGVVVFGVLLAVGVAFASPPAGAATGDITVYNVSPSGGLFPTGGVVEGPDGNLWFANQSNDIGEVSPTGTVTLHDLTGLVDSNDSLIDVTVGGDSNIWFTVPNGGGSGLGEIGRYNPTTDGVDMFSSPVVFPYKITTAADGTLWVLGSSASRILLNGTASVSYNTGGTSSDIMLGPDNNIWITKAHSTESLLRVNPTTGALINEYPITGDLTTNPNQMTIGPDDDIWFTYSGGANGFGGIAHFNDTGDTFTQFPFSSATTPKGIVTGPDGNFWVLARSGAPLRQVTPAGVSTPFSQTGFTIPPSPVEIVLGPGGDLWAGSDNRIGRIDVVAVDPACLPPAFTDVGVDHQFFADICWMDLEGISTGFQPGPTYKPSNDVSRAAMSAFMYRLANSPAFPDPPTATFNDVPTTSQFFTEIEWMAAEGITTGFPGDLYKPSANVSRAAMSAFMYRLADEPAFPDPPTATFNDVATTSQFFTEIEWMADENITTGFPGNLYKPSNNVTRAAMSAFMHRLEPLL
jgi:streptogramin lyase